MESEYEESGSDSYWASVIFGALVIGLIMSIMGLLSQYITISNEPTGASFGIGQAIGTLACLVGAIGGILSTRHYANNVDDTFTIGKGALIGFLTGVVGVLLSTIVTFIWLYIVDTGLTQTFYEWQIANVEAQNLPDAQMEMAISFIPDPNSTSAIMMQVGIGLVVVGILNAISGMIGTKIFAKDED
ncbi:MAG: DUF4199 family protein [Balneolaceae bacterium]